MNSAFGIGRVGISVMILLAFVPIFSNVAEQSFLVTLFTRVMVFAIAAIGLNIALGFGGMVSFGHAMYLGLGAYTAAVMQFHGIESGLIQISAALIFGAFCALIIGVCSLRTSGVAFIMITLAFAQMFYSILISFAQYGGDDGLSMIKRSAVPGIDMEDSVVFYYVVFVILLGCVAFVSRLIGSHYGWVLKGCKSNERRMAALGLAPSRYKLIAYVLSALCCVIAGFLLANLFRFASPSYAHWMISGELIVMVILGGLGTVVGPVLGAFAFLVLEEILSGARLPLPDPYAEMVQSHPLGVLGLLIVVIALSSSRGLRNLMPWQRLRKMK